MTSPCVNSQKVIEVRGSPGRSEMGKHLAGDTFERKIIAQTLSGRAHARLLTVVFTCPDNARLEIGTGANFAELKSSRLARHSFAVFYCVSLHVQLFH